MDRKLEESRLEGGKPFNGETLGLSDLVELSLLYQSLNAIVELLYNRFKLNTMFAFEDWHEHDGYITTSNIISWNELKERVVDEAALYNSRHGDSYVRRAFYPEGREFLLRYYILEDNEDPQFYPGIWGDFDITTNSEMVKAVSLVLPKDVMKKMKISCAKNYFDEQYAG